MSNLYIYGASDDLIEVEGIFSDELNPPYGRPAAVVVKILGTPVARLIAEYDEFGEWCMRLSSTIGIVTILPARGEDEGDDADGCPGYSEKAVIAMGDIDATDVTVELEEVA